MVRYLNAYDLAPYGEIENSVQLPEESALELEGNEHTLRRINGSVTLAPRVNMTVLAVSDSPDRDSVSLFYLDKTVRLRDGVYFALIPVPQSSGIYYMPEGRCTVTDTVLHASEIGFSRTMKVNSVYTAFYQEKEMGFKFKGEKHELPELFYVDRGSLHSIVGGTQTELHQGELEIFAPRQWHMQYSDPGVAPGIVTVTFSADCPYMEELYNRSFRINDGMAQLIHGILDEQEKPGLHSSDVIVGRLETLLISLLRMENAAAGKLRTPVSLHSENELMDGILNYIAENIRCHLTVTDIAAAGNISPSYMSALFRRSLNISPAEYVRRAKLEESKELIRSGQYTFSEIAQMLCFSSVAHFSALFKAGFGMTPTAYARSIHPGK